MNYRSLNDLSQLSTACASKIPNDIELVVGIPRSGMLAASVIALKLNIPLTDVYSFLRNDELKKGSTRTYKHDRLVKPWDAKKVLLVDDSICSGNSMRAAVDTMKDVFAGTVVTMAFFAEKHNQDMVDIHFELVPQPRVFEWNIMHHPFLKDACLDIDGVLCVDPTQDENDDGPNYLGFLGNTRPLFIPSVKVAHLVTSRLEKYRPQTEEWLKRHGVQYGQLHMLDLPSAEERRRLKIHHKFKAEVYAAQPLARLFIESEKAQAVEIMALSNKPVYCIETNRMYRPGELALLRAEALRNSARLEAKVTAKLKAVARKWLPANPARKA